MPHSLRAKIKGLRYKGIITDKDCDRLCKALDNENVLDKIRAEIDREADVLCNLKIKTDNDGDYLQGKVDGYMHSIDILDRWQKGANE